jgi:hypothetical protein
MFLPVWCVHNQFSFIHLRSNAEAALFSFYDFSSILDAVDGETTMTPPHFKFFRFYALENPVPKRVLG